MQATDDDNSSCVRVNGTGAAVGVGEALTDIPRLSSVKADTHIEAFYITTKVFKHIMDSNDTVRLLFCAVFSHHILRLLERTIRYLSGVLSGDHIEKIPKNIHIAFVQV